MAAITDLASASSVAVGDYLVISQSGTDKKVTANKFAIQTAGTWTPSLRFGGADTGLTYANRYGRYYVLGGLVFAFAQFELSAKGSSTGAVTVTGLPFPSINTANFYTPVFLQAYAVTGTFIEGNIAPAASTITLYSLASGTRSALTDAAFTASSVMQITAIYEA